MLSTLCRQYLRFVCGFGTLWAQHLSGSLRCFCKSRRSVVAPWWQQVTITLCLYSLSPCVSSLVYCKHTMQMPFSLFFFLISHHLLIDAIKWIFDSLTLSVFHFSFLSADGYMSELLLLSYSQVSNCIILSSSLLLPRLTVTFKHYRTCFPHSMIGRLCHMQENVTLLSIWRTHRSLSLSVALCLSIYSAYPIMLPSKASR